MVVRWTLLEQFPRKELVYRVDLTGRDRKWLQCLHGLRTQSQTPTPVPGSIEDPLVLKVAKTIMVRKNLVDQGVRSYQSYQDESSLI